MGNCLVTKLKESVNDDSLIRIGAAQLVVRQMTNPTDDQIKLSFKVTGSDSVTVIAKGSGYFATSVAGLQNDPKTEMSFSSRDGDVNLYFANDNYYVEITNKASLYKLTTGDIFGFDLSIFEYASNINTLAGNGSFGNIKALKTIPNLTILNISTSECYGDIKELETNQYLDLVYIENTNITGDVAFIGKLQHLRVFMLTNTKVYGNIEDFVANQIIAGNNGSYGVQLGRALPLLNFGGVKHPSANTFSSYIFWENSSKMFVVYGSSRDYTPQNTTTIYCKGYTQQEVEAKWPTFASSQIVRVDA